MQLKNLVFAGSVLFLGSQSFGAFSASVYQWVDSEGVTHFSDQTPVKGKAVNQLSHFEIEENFPRARDPEEDYFSIVNQWKRTNEEREASLKLKQEKARNRKRSPQRQASSARFEEQAPRYYTNALPFFYNRGPFLNRRQFAHSRPRKQMQAMPPLSRGAVGNVSSQ